MAKIKLRLWFRKLTIKTSAPSPSSSSFPSSSSSTQFHLPLSTSNCGPACVNELQELPCAENVVLQLSNLNGKSTSNLKNTATPNPNNVATVPKNPIIVSSNHPENTIRNPNPLTETAAVGPQSRFREVNMSAVHCGCSHYSTRFASSFRKSTQDILASSCKGRSSDPTPAFPSNDVPQSPTNLEGNRGDDHRNRSTRVSSSSRGIKKRVSKRTSDSTFQESDNDIQNKERENGVSIASRKTRTHQSANSRPCVKGSDNGAGGVHGKCVENSSPCCNHRALKKDMGCKKAHETLIRDYFSSLAITNDDAFSYGDKAQQSFSSNSSSDKLKRFNDKKNRHRSCQHVMDSSVDGRSSRSFRDIQVDNVTYLNANENGPMPNGKRLDASNYLVRIKEEYQVEDKKVMVSIEDDSSSFSKCGNGRNGVQYVTGVELRQSHNAGRQTGLKVERMSRIDDREEMVGRDHKQGDEDICPFTLNVSRQEEAKANGIFGKEEKCSSIAEVGALVSRRRKRNRSSSRKLEQQHEGPDLGGDPHMRHCDILSPSSKLDSVSYGLRMSPHGVTGVDEDNGGDGIGVVEASSTTEDDNDGHHHGIIKDDDGHADGNYRMEDDYYCDSSCYDDDDKGVLLAVDDDDSHNGNGNGNGNGSGCVAVMKCSNDPVADFHGSMRDVIMASGAAAAAAEEEEEEEEWWRRRVVVMTASDMEALLLCYLSLNSQEHHHAIVTAFTQVWKEAFANDEEL